MTKDEAYADAFLYTRRALADLHKTIDLLAPYSLDLALADHLTTTVASLIFIRDKLAE